METRAPSAAARWARARPMPLDPPVMKTWRDLIGILTGLGRTIRAKMIRREMRKRMKKSKREEMAAMEILESSHKLGHGLGFDHYNFTSIKYHSTLDQLYPFSKDNSLRPKKKKTIH